MAIALLTIGIPGSGKTTQALQFTKGIPGMVYLCADDIREELTGDAGDQSCNPEVWELLYERAEKALKSGQSVLIDALNCKQQDRLRLVQHCQDAGAKEIIGIYVICDVKLATERANARSRKVPPRVIERECKNLTRCQPTLEEGFSQIMRIVTS